MNVRTIAAVALITLGATACVTPIHVRKSTGIGNELVSQRVTTG